MDSNSAVAACVLVIGSCVTIMFVVARVCWSIEHAGDAPSNYAQTEQDPTDEEPDDG